MADGWKRDWQFVIDQVGAQSETASEVKWGADLVEAGAIRRYLEPLEFDCELHTSQEVAQRNGYPGIIAPYTSTSTWTRGPLWRPGSSTFTSPGRNAQPVGSVLSPTATGQYPPRATGYFATDIAIAFVRPPFVGDRLGQRAGRLVDVSLKETSVGRGAFLKTESTIVDAARQTIATIQTGLFVYEPIPQRRPRATASREATEEQGNLAVVLGRQRVGTDVVVGEYLSPIAFPLPVYRLVMEAGVNRDFNSIHHNTEFAQASGAPEMYANTVFLQGMWERVVRTYIGDSGVIVRISGFRMRSFNCAGDTVTVRGRVGGVRAVGLGTEVDLHLWSENSTGVSVGPGTVTAILPNG